MTISSMTGYARGDGRQDPYSWTWEGRSVNGKNLEVRCRLPVGYEHLETPVKQRVGQALSRGNVSLTLNVRREQGGGHAVINRDLLDEIVALRDQLGDRLSPEPLRLEPLLAVRGLFEIVEDEEDEAATSARDAAILESLVGMTDALARMRADEGRRLDGVVRGLLDEIAGLVGEARSLAATQPEALRKRLADQVAQLLEAGPELPQDRLLQEAALLATKADVREELDRLDAHVAAARELLDGAGSVGRRLDFLCQEFNREANTLCSKAADIALTRIGLGLKSAVDQMREQVQNVE